MNAARIVRTLSVKEALSQRVIAAIPQLQKLIFKLNVSLLMFETQFELGRETKSFCKPQPRL